VGIIANLPPEKKEYWKNFMKKCPNCPVYKEHKEEKDQTLKDVESM
jgi:predicted DNA binding CopG/RHH family protein